MKNRLSTIFIIQIGAFTAAVLLISYLMFYQLSVDKMQRRVTAEFESELELLAEEVKYKSLIAEEKVKALASRTMIRRKLHAYHDGELSLREVRNYTRQKYADGAEVYGNLVLAVRRDIEGRLIAEYHAGEYEPPPEAGEHRIMFFEAEEGYRIYIEEPIVHRGTRIGTDAAVFALESLATGRHSFVEQVELLREAREDTRLDSYSRSVPVGKTGYYLHAELRQEALEEEKAGIGKSAVLLSALLIAAVLAVSYLTILRLTLNLLKERDRVNERLSDSVREKEYLLRELHHRVKNNLNLIVSFLELQSSDTDSPELSERNRELQSRINAISLVHEKLQTENSGLEVSLGEYLEDLCRKIIETRQSGEVDLRTDFSAAPRVSSKQAISVGLIYSELTMNSLKHAAAEKAGRLTITIGLSSRGSEHLLTYVDDGVPFPEDFDLETASSLGLMVVQRLVRQLDGRLEYDFSRDKKITIVIPAA